jgi:DNA modification methylase
MESQGHGVAFENDVIKSITGLSKDEYQSLLNNAYTASMDIKKDVHSDRNYSIKASKDGLGIGCGDILRFVQHCRDDEFTIIVGAWKQLTKETKEYYEIYEFDITPSDYQKLWGGINKEHLEPFVLYVKSIPEGKNAQLANRVLWKDKRNAIYDAYGQGIMSIDAKIDSKKQRRVQCGVSIVDLINAGFNYRKYVDKYRDIVLPYRQDSESRKFKDKDSMADRKLTDIFGVPPISVLDIKQKYWKDKKREWLAIGIQSELGRGENLLGHSKLMQKKHNATSVFDPVLCEAMYSWFTMQGDTVFDPFAGGSVRGVVASLMKRDYVGVDLRPEQVQHNQKQANDICKYNTPTWLVGSSEDVTIDREYDFFFTCPPYYDLEVYSDNEKDLSNLPPDEFDKVFEKIISLSLSKLKQNRFAAIVIGDVRGQDGFYLKFLSKTIDAFEKNGCRYYNDLILLQEPATAAMRSFGFMNKSRKIAKCHQNVLVFVKGDAIEATKRLPQFSDEQQESNETQDANSLETFFE